MKKISILLLALCVFTSGNSQITLTKDVSYGNNGTVKLEYRNVYKKHNT